MKLFKDCDRIPPFKVRSPFLVPRGTGEILGMMKFGFLVVNPPLNPGVSDFFQPKITEKKPGVGGPGLFIN